MAKISSCYQLCPFMDPKNFLGVSGDCESGYVIVTLGRNIVIRYKISDQRQVNSWNTTIKLSAPVVYDKQSERYVGVFNSSIIQMWNQSEVDLSKIKKYKFTNSIHSILASPNVEGLIVLYKNGQVSLLSTALQNRKFSCDPNSSDLIIGEDEVIDDAFLLHISKKLVVAIKTTHKSKESKLLFRPVGSTRFRPFSMSLDRDQDTKLTGYAFMNEENLQLFTIWSDGNLYALEFSLSTLDSIESQYPGKLIMNVSAVNTKLKVALLPLSPYHVAVYGSDPSEEGALLIIVNVWHRLIQCRYFFKLYCTSPKLWHGGASDLLLIVGNHLAVAHFRLVAQQLATLLGTQPATHTRPSLGEGLATLNDSLDQTDTQLVCPTEPPQTPDELQTRIDCLLENGLSEAAIANTLFPHYLEKENTDMLYSLCNSSQLVDVPAEYHLKTLGLCMKPGRVGDCKRLVELVLSQPVQNDDRSLAIARGQFDAAEVVTLIDQLTERLIERPYCARTIDWATFVIDAFCQHFLFTKDAVSNNALDKLRNVIDNQMKHMNVWQELITLINFVTLKQEAQNQQLGSKEVSGDNSIYICEELNLFEK